VVEAMSRVSIRYVLSATSRAPIYGRGLRAADRAHGWRVLGTLCPGAIKLLLGVADATTEFHSLLALSAQGCDGP